MAIPVEGEGRFRTLRLTVDTKEDIGRQVLVARAAGFSWKQLEELFALSRQTMHEHASEARARLSA